MHHILGPWQRNGHRESHIHTEHCRDLYNPLCFTRFFLDLCYLLYAPFMDRREFHSLVEEWSITREMHASPETRVVHQHDDSKRLATYFPPS